MVSSLLARWPRSLRSQHGGHVFGSPATGTVQRRPWGEVNHGCQRVVEKNVVRLLAANPVGKENRCGNEEAKPAVGADYGKPANFSSFPDAKT